MPVIELDYRELCELSGINKAPEWFIDTIPSLGASFEGAEGDTLRFEFFPNRPDHYSVEGVARTLRYYTGSEVKEYVVSPSDKTVMVEDAVKKIRPFIACAIARGVHIDERALKSLIGLQEKLHLTVGRRRKKVAIGLHDISAVKFPVVYYADDGKSTKFKPLGSDTLMTPSEVMEKTEKGREFGWIVGNGPFPMLKDEKGDVLSMPPIINGTMTALSEGTRDIFIDVTGTDFNVCSGVLNILCAAVADRGGRLESINIRNKESTITTPEIVSSKILVDLKLLNSLIGVKLSDKEAIELLRKMGHTASLNGKRLEVHPPFFRMDIMHPVDIVEDAAIALGFANLGHSLPVFQTIGKRLNSTLLKERVAELMVGYGFTQVITFMLSGTAIEFDRMRLERGAAVRLQNPVTEDRDILRTSLLPGMLLLFEANRHNELPQKMFEIGDVHSPEKKGMVAAASAHSKASFAEIKSLAEALKRDMASTLKFSVSSDPRFIEGRQMEMLDEKGRVGIFGELHPEVITNFNLATPIVAIEFELDRFAKLR